MNRNRLQAPLEYITEVTSDEFAQKVHGKPIAVIYPRNRKQSAFVAMFMQVYQQRMVYYKLGADDINLHAWLGHMAESDLLAGHLTQTRAILAERPTPEECAAAFGADLRTLRSDRYMFLLDTFDYLTVDYDAEQFIRALPAYIPDHAQIVISARLLGLQPWNDLVRAGQVAIVGNEGAINGGIYGDDLGLGQLEVHALDGGHVYVDGMPVVSWDGSLPRHLFYYFVDHPMVTRDQIFSVFWPRMGVKEATNVFHVTKRKISERLGHELTSYSSGFYTHSPGIRVHYDARLFEDWVDSAIDNESEGPNLWYSAIQLYRSDFLPYIDMPWVRERRATLQQKYAQALINLGRYYRDLDDLNMALGYLLRAIRVKPDWEDVHQDVMRIYAQQGRKKELLVQYQQLEHTLNKMFGIKPTQHTQKLFESLKT